MILKIYVKRKKADLGKRGYNKKGNSFKKMNEMVTDQKEEVDKQLTDPLQHPRGNSF